MVVTYTKLLLAEVLMSKKQGFTLIEVMVAMTIFAVSLIVIINLFSKSLRASSQLHNYTIGLILAQSKMAQIKAYLETELEGTFREGDVKYEWLVNTYETEFEGIEKVQLIILWEGREGKKSIELIGYRVIKPKEDKEEKIE
jgi:type II secretion system protein I